MVEQPSLIIEEGEDNMYAGCTPVIENEDIMEFPVSSRQQSSLNEEPSHQTPPTRPHKA